VLSGVERLGSNRTIRVDIRLWRRPTAIWRDGHDEFLSDLYYRLNVFPIVNLPLRIGPPIPALVHHAEICDAHEPAHHDDPD
jgi:transcriptional regulator with GAF, ATPase, and Fis domain